MKMPIRAAFALLALSCAPALAQPDEFPGSNATTPCRNWTAITPSDTIDLTRLPKAIYVGSGGDLAMIAPDASAGVIWKSIPTASLIPVRPRRILSTGTTATSIVACF